jgi:uncharacterized protein YndB with AHSA1/START domain
VAASPEDVFAVLGDGWSYGSWVVGSARIRAVPDDWPQPGSKLYHSVGVWPVMLSDHTEVLECDPPRRLVLLAKGRPLGEATVEIVVTPEGAGSRVVIGEDVATSGVRALVPRPLRSAMIRARNVETLRRLAMLAERATSPTGQGALGGDQAAAQSPAAPAVTE